MRKAEIKMSNELARWLSQDEDGYHFKYAPMYLQLQGSKPISLTLPMQENKYTGKVLFSFFDGLIHVGWLLEIAEKNWKLNDIDRMGLLMACCKDCIGAVSVNSLNENEL